MRDEDDAELDPGCAGLVFERLAADGVHGDPIEAFTVVTSALTSTSSRWRSTWSVHALSFPLLHQSQTRFMSPAPLQHVAGSRGRKRRG